MKEIINEFSRFDIFLKNIKYGFLMVETNSQYVKQSVIRKISENRKELCVDFAKNGTDLYSLSVTNSEHDAFIFYNVESLGNPLEVIESFNLNRDNFLHNKALYVFVLSKELSDYVRRETANLYSYVIAHFKMSLKFDIPFRPIMSLDNFVIDKEKIHNAKNLNTRRLDLTKDVGTLNNIIDRIDYFEYVRASEEDIDSLVSDLSVYINNNEECSHTLITELLLEIIVIVFRQEMYELAEGLCVLFLFQNFLEYDDEDDEIKVLYQKWQKHLLDDNEAAEAKHKLYDFIFVQTIVLKDELPLMTNLQLVKLLRLLATSVFYLKNYNEAADWLVLILSIIDADDTSNNDYTEIKILTKNDLAICYYKLTNLKPWDNWFKQALDESADYDCTIHTNFVIDYNQLVYKILANDMLKEDFELAQERADFYRESVTEKSSIFSSYLTLVAWARGCIAGNVTEGLTLCQKSLEIKRMVFTENHYSIAESHYCNAVLYRLAGDFKQALHCAKKARNILNVNREKNHTLLGIANDFLVDIAENCGILQDLSGNA